MIGVIRLQERHFTLNKYASIINRHGMRYYDQELNSLGVGAGQQFFLVRIFENQGINVYDLAKCGHYDKATATRAIHKLEEFGLIRREADPTDGRVCRLYTTEKARPIVNSIYAAVRKWNDILTRGMSEEEVVLAERLMELMAKNAYEFTKDNQGGKTV